MAHDETLTELRKEIDEARKERDEARISFAVCAEAIGVERGTDAGSIAPGHVADVVSAIHRARQEAVKWREAKSAVERWEAVEEAAREVYELYRVTRLALLDVRHAGRIWAPPSWAWAKLAVALYAVAGKKGGG